MSAISAFLCLLCPGVQKTAQKMLLRILSANTVSYYKKLDVCVCVIVSLSALSPSIIFCMSVTSNGQMENQD